MFINYFVDKNVYLLLLVVSISSLRHNVMYNGMIPITVINMRFYQYKRINTSANVNDNK